MTDAVRTVAVAFLGLAAGLTWYAARTVAIPTTSPDRLVAELRLSQFAALLLALIAGAYIGFAVRHEAQPGVGLDIALTVGFLVMAATTLVRSASGADGPRARPSPRTRCSTSPIARRARRRHRAALVPRWLRGLRVYIGALCYFPILRR